RDRSRCWRVCARRRARGCVRRLAAPLGRFGRRGPAAAARRPVPSGAVAGAGGSRRLTVEGPGPELFRPALASLVPYEPGKPAELVQREIGLEHVAKLASNEGPFGPFPEALEAIGLSLAEANRYPDGGAYRLRTALAERHGVAFEEIAVGSGADGLIDGISQAVLDPGDEIVCGWPSFPSYLIYAAKLGAA